MGVFKEYVRGGIPFAQRINPVNGPIVYKKVAATLEDQSNQSPKGVAEIQFTSRADDLKRIATLLTQPPGLKYIANETLLRTSTTKKSTQDTIRTANDPEFDPGKSSFGQKLGQLGQGLLGTAAILGSTLAQVPLNGTGTHFVRGFAGLSRRNYLSTNIETPPHVLAAEGKPILSSLIAKPVITGDQKLTQAEDGALGSLYVVGNDSSEETGPGSLLASGSGLKNTSNLTNLRPGFFVKNNPLQQSVMKDQRVRLGMPSSRYFLSGSSNKDAEHLWNTLDRINVLNPTVSENAKLEQDFAKFRFRVIQPGEEDVLLVFRSYIDSFSDNFNGTWNSWKYNGRAENFYTYSGFDRQIQIGFKIAAQTRFEMRPLYRKIAYLASTTAPSYGTNQIMKGTLVKMTVGDYVHEIPGFISSLTYSWDTNYPWEIGMYNKNQEERGFNTETGNIEQQQLPMILDCNLNFTIIHDFLPETGLRHFITAPPGASGKQGSTEFFDREGNIVYNDEGPGEVTSPDLGQEWTEGE